MIIKHNPDLHLKKNWARAVQYFSIALILALLLFTITVLVYRFVNERTQIKNSDFIVYGDAEQISDGQFVKGEYTIPHAHHQSDEQAFEGNYSFRLVSPDNTYGLVQDVNNMQLGDVLIARVWMLPNLNFNGCIAIKSMDDKFYVQSAEPIAESGNWRLLEVVAKVTKPIKDGKLRIFCYNQTKEPVYFDNVSFYKNDKPIKLWEPEKINLMIKEGEYNKLVEKRNAALDNGILISEEDSWVKGAIYPENKDEDKTKVSLRLKGDWLDHLQGDKWSYRVKTETEKSWNRLKVFSLQDPFTRSYLKEWLLHQLFRYEDILTTRYDFVELVLNHKNKGVYVYEEHFMKQIPEYNLRREGPIVRFTEDGFWESRLVAMKLGLDFLFADKKANPDVRPFAESKTKAAPNLEAQFNIAQNLCYEYQFGLKPASEIFSLELLAKYYAIMDLMGAHHGMIWHNQRFYYNPVIGKLEPIGYDGYDKYGNTWIKQPFVGYGQANNKEQVKRWHEHLFQDPAFVELYLQYLDKFADKKYINKFLAHIQNDLNDRLFYLMDHVKGYDFSTDYMYQRAANIKLALEPNSKSIQTRTNAKGDIAICNAHKIPAKIIGFSNQEEGYVIRLDSTVWVKTNLGLPNFSQVIPNPKKYKYLVYEVPGIAGQHFLEINPWAIPSAYTPMQELAANLQEDHPAYYYDKDTKVLLFKDSAIIAQPIIIPKGHTVVANSGTYLDIIKKAFIISYSAIEFIGSEERPIVVNSSDGTANGFTVLNATEKSKVNYTIFQNMNTLSYKGWNLTGAVTFYESDVDIYHSVFTRNSCEDALNIIRSRFLFDNSVVSHTFADGFDADFCAGTVQYSTFMKTGNDGIDFSTSNIKIKNTKILNVGDKGISIGEQGKAYVIDTKIDGAVIGIASKDLSEVQVVSADLNNCKQGFAAYQKKPEYGGGKIVVKQYTAKNTEILHKILPGSYLKLLDQEITSD